MRPIFAFFIGLAFVCTACTAQHPHAVTMAGATQTAAYLPLLKNRRVGVVANHTSLIQQTHLVDSLLSLGIEIKKIFSPEHGFRGKIDRGVNIKDGKDVQTGLPIISLHGKNRKPSKDHLMGLDIMIFDIQDVGVRFYTYLSTMHYVMEACAENHIPLIVLDRPNPNGDYVAGPVLDPAYRSFVGMHPIPIVHGMTLGELAKMINGEKWLKNEVHCALTVVPCTNYTHSTVFDPPVKPSPNLPNYQSIRLYPSLCLFEPTQVSIGRGTLHPFQIMGYPGNNVDSFAFTPKSIEGMSSNPKHKDVRCGGQNLQHLTPPPKFTLKYLLEYYSLYQSKTDFFTDEAFFNLLAGSDQLLKQVKQKESIENIEKSWEPQLSQFKVKRKRYLLYPDFKK